MSEDYGFDMPENVDPGGERINKDGWFHGEIIRVNTSPTNTKTKEPIKGFQITVECLAHEDDTQAGKTKDFTFYAPDPSQGDGGDFCRLKYARLFLATCLVKPGYTGNAKFDRQDMVRRQFIAKLEFQKDKQKKVTEFVDIAGAHIYHVDDKEVADRPRSDRSLQALDDSLRWKNGESGGESSKPSGGGKPSGKPNLSEL